MSVDAAILLLTIVELLLAVGLVVAFCYADVRSTATISIKSGVGVYKQVGGRLHSRRQF